MRNRPARNALSALPTSSCVEWTGFIGKDGYGFGMLPIVGGRRTYTTAHRIVFLLAGGVIPDDMQLDHLCRNRACVNPAHLEPVTRLVNMRRGSIATKTHCVHGHEYDAANTILRPNNRGRLCRTCLNERQRRRYHAKKAAGVTAQAVAA